MPHKTSNPVVKNTEAESPDSSQSRVEEVEGTSHGQRAGRISLKKWLVIWATFVATVTILLISMMWVWDGLKEQREAELSQRAETLSYIMTIREKHDEADAQLADVRMILEETPDEVKKGGDIFTNSNGKVLSQTNRTALQESLVAYADWQTAEMGKVSYSEALLEQRRVLVADAAWEDSRLKFLAGGVPRYSLQIIRTGDERVSLIEAIEGNITLVNADVKAWEEEQRRIEEEKRRAAEARRRAAYGAPRTNETLAQRIERIYNASGIPKLPYIIKYDICSGVANPSVVLGCYIVGENRLHFSTNLAKYPDCRIRQTIAHEYRHWWQYKQGWVLDRDAWEADARAFSRKYGC